MRVHAALGSGFQEVISQRCLAIEMQDASLAFTREIEMSIFYQEQEVGSRRVDFLVEKTVVVELKAVSELTPIHLICPIPLSGKRIRVIRVNPRFKNKKRVPPLYYGGTLFYC